MRSISPHIAWLAAVALGALPYVTDLTRDKKVDPNTFARLARDFSEREICQIVWLVASEHLYNVTNIGLNIGALTVMGLVPSL